MGVAEPLVRDVKGHGSVGVLVDPKADLHRASSAAHTARLGSVQPGDQRRIGLAHADRLPHATRMDTRTLIHEKLSEALSPKFIDVIDQSAAHAGHAGNSGGGHFRVLLVAAQFEA